jgi:uncharacterized protein
MAEVEKGLYVAGALDLDTSEVAREVWRSMKANRVSLSFGFVTTKSHERADGVTELHEIDLFEVSIVSAPANADTRILSLKSATTDTPACPPMPEWQRQWLERSLALDHERYGTSAKSVKQDKPLRIASFNA